MSETVDPDLARERHCIDLARQHDPDRYLCALVAPAAARRALLCLLAFNAELARTREVVAEPLLGEIRLQWWRESLDEAFAGRPRRHPIVEELAATSKRQSLPLLQALIEARLRDLDPQPIGNRAELEAYVLATAGTLARASAAILAPGNQTAAQAAEAVGHGWGLIGIIRAVPFLAAQRRLLLPADRLQAHGVTPEALFDGKPEPGLRHVLEELAATAAGRLQAARALAKDQTRPALPALLPAVLADAYLERLSQIKFAVFERPVEISPLSRPLRVLWSRARQRY